jgi:hypothetical protein
MHLPEFNDYCLCKDMVPNLSWEYTSVMRFKVLYKRQRFSECGIYVLFEVGVCI